jgi:hypothetical protein
MGQFTAEDFAADRIYPRSSAPVARVLPVRERASSAGWIVPMTVPQLTRGILNRAGAEECAVRDRELEDLAVQHDGGPEALGERYFPLPDGQTQMDWEDLKERLLVHVNLVKTSVRSLRTAVYGGTARRTIVENPHAEEMTRVVGRKYGRKMRGFFDNKVTFGTAVGVWVLHPLTRRLALWQPNPCTLRLYSDPMLVDEYLGVVEFSLDGKIMRFVTPEAMGWLEKGQEPVLIGRRDDVPQWARSVVQVTDFGFLPAQVGFGEERTHRGKKYGVSLVREMVKASVRASDALFNASMYQKLYTRAILWVKGMIEKNPQGDDLMEIYRGFLNLDSDKGGVGYAVPESRMGDILDLYKTLIMTSAVVTGIPLDDVSPQWMQDQSAEAARRRAQPLTSLAAELKETSEQDEQDLVVKGTALLEWRDGRRVDLDELEDRVATDIALAGTVNPIGDTERGSNTIQLMGAGLLSDEDAVADWNPRKGVKERGEMVAEIRRRRGLTEKQKLSTPRGQEAKGPSTDAGEAGGGAGSAMDADEDGGI